MSVTACINFIEPQQDGSVEKPYQLKFEPPEGFPATNITSREHAPKVEDIRGREYEYSVAKTGFAIMHLPDDIAYEDYDNEDIIQQVYFKQVAEGLQDSLQASRVQIFEHVVSIRRVSACRGCC
jgi:hypothetical protein